MKKHYKLSYDRHLLIKDGGIEYSGEYIVGVSVFFEIAVLKDGKEVLFSVDENEEPCEQYLDCGKNNPMYEQWLSYVFSFYVDPATENGYRIELTEIAKNSGYEFKLTPESAFKWVGSWSNPVAIPCEEFFDILKNNLNAFDRSDNKPAQNTSYGIIEVNVKETQLTEAEHNAVVDDMSEIYPAVIKQLVALADKHNVDRDVLVKYFAATFSAMAEISTFVNWGNNDESN